MVGFSDKKCVEMVNRVAEKAFYKIRGHGSIATAVGNACLYMLAETKGMVGIPFLVGLEQKVLQRQTKPHIAKLIKKAAEKSGLTLSEFVEESIPD